MADLPVVPSKKNELPKKIHDELDYSEHRRNFLDSDNFYDCEEEIDNQQTQNCTVQSPNPLSEEQNMLNCTITENSLTQPAGTEENSDEQKTGNKRTSLEQSTEEEELSEVLKKLLHYGEEIRACVRQCGVDADSFDCITPECTGTEPCLEPFVDSRENPEPTARGDTECHSEENDTSTCTVPFICGLPGEEVWCSASSSPRALNRSETPVSVIDTVHNLRLDSLEEYFRENSNGLMWPKSSEEDKEEEKTQLPQLSDKQTLRLMKKSKSDSAVLCSCFQEQRSEDEEGYETDSSSSIEPEREQSSTEWSTLSCHTVSTLSNGSENDDRSNSVDAIQDDDVYLDDLEGRPDAAGDGIGSHISVHVTDGEIDEGIYEIDIDDHFFTNAESGDQDVLDNALTYNFNLLPENDAPRRLTLATEQMLDELFPGVRLQPRPVRLLQSLPDHPVSENTTGGGEGDYELGRRIVVQSFFVENGSPLQEEADRSSWRNTGLDGGWDSLRDLLRWTTLAGVCATAFLIWQFRHSFR